MAVGHEQNPPAGLMAGKGCRGEVVARSRYLIQDSKKAKETVVARVDWMVIEKGKCSIARFNCEELQLKRSLLQTEAGFLSVLNHGRGEAHCLFLCSVGGAFYPVDEQGVNALCRAEREHFGEFEESEQLDEEASLLAQHIHKDADPTKLQEIWLNSRKFYTACSDEQRDEANELFQNRIKSQFSPESSITIRISEVSKPFQKVVSAFPKTAQVKKNGEDDSVEEENSESVDGFREKGIVQQVFQSLFRTGRKNESIGKRLVFLLSTGFFALLCVSVLLAFFFGSSIRGYFFARHAGQETLSVISNFESFSFVTKSLSALSPEPMRAMEAAVLAKVDRNGVSYAHALFSLDRQRKYFPPDLLPSKSFVAAIAMNNVSRTELDALPTWRKFLSSLQSERLKGISVISYEESKIRELFRQKLGLARSKGVSAEQGAYVYKLFSLPAMAASKETEGSVSKNRTMPNATKEFEEVFARLQRLQRVFKEIPKKERVTRNILVSQALFQAIQLSWLYDKAMSNKTLDTRLSKMLDLIAELPRPEKDILKFLIGERLDGMARTSSQAVLAGRRIAFINSLHEEAKLLCNPWSSTLFPDFFSQTLHVLSQGKELKVSLAPLSTWSQCFPFKRAYYPVEAAGFEGGSDVDIFSYIPRNRVLASVDTVPEFQLNIGQQKAGSAYSSWLAYGLLADFLVPGEKLKWLSEKSCGVFPFGERLCQLLQLKFAGSVLGQMNELRKAQEDLSFEEQAEFSFLLALEFYSGARKAGFLPGTKAKLTKSSIIQSFSEMGFQQYVGTRFSEFPTLEWYIKNVLVARSVGN